MKKQRCKICRSIFWGPFRSGTISPLMRTCYECLELESLERLREAIEDLAYRYEGMDLILEIRGIRIEL